MNPLATVGDLESVVDPARFVDPKEALVDVYRVVEPMQRQMEETGKGVSKLRKTLDGISDPTHHATDETALMFLRRIAKGLHSIPTPTHSKVAVELLRQHPEWLSPMLFHEEQMPALFEYRIEQFRREEGSTAVAEMIVCGAICGAIGLATGIVQGIAGWDYWVVIPQSLGGAGILSVLYFMKAKQKLKKLKDAYFELGAAIFERKPIR